MPSQQLIRADAAWDKAPLQLPLTGAWFCKTFSPALMPWLYGAALLWLWPLRKKARGGGGPQLDALLETYPTCLFPTLSLALESIAYSQLPGQPGERSLNIGFSEVSWQPPEQTSLSGTAAQAANLDIPDASLDHYRLNNVIHQVQDRFAVLDEAARVVKSGGYLQLTDNTRGWVDAIWLIKAARRLGKVALAQRLVEDKLKSSGQNLVPCAGWWTENPRLDQWEVVEARPFFSASSMTVASVFESLNFKQGGTSPDWLAGRIVRNRFLRPLYRALVRNLSHSLVELDPELTARSEGVFLLVTLRRK